MLCVPTNGNINQHEAVVCREPSFGELVLMVTSTKNGETKILCHLFSGHMLFRAKGPFVDNLLTVAEKQKLSLILDLRHVNEFQVGKKSELFY